MASKHKNEGRTKSRRLKRNAMLLMFVSVVLMICLSLVWSWCKEVCYIPIEVVSLADKLQYADPALVKAAVAKEVKRGFFGIRLNLMRDNLLQVPWVVGVQVQRKWPNTVLLKVQERQPLALWGDKGVIDTTGKLFFPPSLNKSALPGLPEFIGDQTRLLEMVDTYLRVLAKIKPIGLAVQRLIIMPDTGWQAMLDNGVTIILGQNELEERLTRFVLAYGDQKFGLRNDKVHVVDLRYTNGLATSG